MNLSLIIFIVAVATALLIFALRFYEHNYGKLVISKEKRISIEKWVVNFYHRMIEKMASWYFSTKNFLKNFPTLMAHIMHFYWRKFSKKVDQFFLKIRHKK